MRTRLASLIVAAALGAAAAAHAGDTVTQALQAAYVPYRSALFRTNGGNAAEAEQALAAARKQWAAVSERYARERPPPYDTDTAFGATLEAVNKAYERAAGEIKAGKLSEAHETLESVRDLTAELRKRNGVVVFSDHMNAYHAQMEHVLGEGPKLLADARGLRSLLAEVGALRYLAGRLRIEAPAAVAADADFKAMVGAVEDSVKGLESALLEQDAGAARAALAKVKSPYARLFVRFG